MVYANSPCCMQNGFGVCIVSKCYTQPTNFKSFDTICIEGFFNFLVFDIIIKIEDLAYEKSVKTKW